MRNLKAKLNSMWGAVLVICLVIVISSAATATASKLINGKNIKKNTITGKQVKESSLATVPKATSAINAGVAQSLSGFDPAAYVKSNAKLYTGSHYPDFGQEATLVDAPGFGRLYVYCNLVGDGLLNFENHSGTSVAIAAKPSGSDSNNAVTTPGLANGSAYLFPFNGIGVVNGQIWQKAENGKSMTFTAANSDCGASASAIVAG
ncbi:MAG: hypothetical protein ACRDKI_10970 [Solirubrobacterales bacterium]